MCIEVKWIKNANQFARTKIWYKCVCVSVVIKKDINVVLWMNSDVGVLNIFGDWVDAYKDNYNYVVDKVECVIMEPLWGIRFSIYKKRK